MLLPRTGERTLDAETKHVRIVKLDVVVQHAVHADHVLHDALCLHHLHRCVGLVFNLLGTQQLGFVGAHEQQVIEEVEAVALEELAARLRILKEGLAVFLLRHHQHSLAQ